MPFLRYRSSKAVAFLGSPNFLPVHKEPASTGFTAAAEEVTTVKDAKIRISSAGSIKVMRKKKRSKNSKKKD